MGFEMCEQCKKRHIRDRKHFSTTTICGKCYEKRDEFLKKNYQGLTEAFLFQLGPNPSAMNVCYVLEKWIRDNIEKDKNNE